MAQTFTTASGSVLIIPDSSVDVVVASQPSGVALSGVIALVGEADEGPSWQQDKADGIKPSSQSFGPGDIGRVISKFGSGRLVDAYRGIVAPSASTRIQGSPNRIILIKSNDSTKASLTTQDSHGTFQAKRGGALGNSISEAVSTAQSEAAPTTSSFSYVPSASSASLAIRANGEAQQTLAISADTSPAALATALTGLSKINAVGGVDRAFVSALTVSDTLQLQVVSGQVVKFKLATPDVFTVTPQAGDVIRVPAGSVIEGGSAENVGWYLVTAVSNTTALAEVTAKKITAGAPLAVAPTAFSATPADDLVCFSSIKIDNMSGVDRNVLSGLTGQNITVSVVGSALTATLASGQVFANRPQVGDIAYIPSGSPYQGAGSANVGWYQLTEVLNTTTSAYIKMSRLSNGSPVAVAAAAISGASNIQVLDRQIKGVGKALEIKDNAGTVNVNTMFKQLAVDSAVTFLGSLLTSSAELRKTISVKLGQSESSITVGGQVALQLGYAGTTATATVGEVSGVLRLQTSVTGGLGANLDLDLSKIATIADLVTKINQNVGYSAAVGSSLDGQRNPSVLDQCTVSICSAANRPGRIKRDLYDLTLGNGSLASNSLVSYDATATAGLPEDNSYAFLSGGDKGGSSGLQLAQAIDALASVRCNFVVPLVSQDAADDIADDETEPTSTYTVDAVNAAVRAHVIAMSTAKVKRHRVGVVSKRGTFQQAKDSALNMANYRIAHTFQDVFDLDSNGDINQFQPWMGSVKAAGMQAAGGYKAIFNKSIACSGAVHADGSFDDENVSDCEDAILAGLMPIQRQETGGFTFLTDQTTYGIDNNVVYNSLNVVYVADLMALSLAESLKRAFVGESTADVTNANAESFIRGKMAEFLSLKYIVGTDQYVSGWKSISVSISGSVMEVGVSAIIQSPIRFIPITLTVEGVKSSSSAQG